MPELRRQWAKGGSVTDRTTKRAAYHAKQVEHVATVLDRGVSVGGTTRPWVQIFAECVRRGSIPAAPDGFASGGGQAGPKNQISDSTGNMAMRRLGATNDPVGDATSVIFATLNQIEQLANTLVDRVSFVLTVDEGIRGRVASVDTCPICDATITGVGEDRVKRGFCSKCYQAGLRAKKAAGDRFDWHVWQLQRVDELRAEGVA